jgi:hypothetical protein
MGNLLQGKQFFFRGFCVMILKNAQTALAHFGVAENN